MDFTSRPTAKKPITVACGRLVDQVLAVSSIRSLQNWDEFEAFLRTPGPWRAAFDFPFAHAASFVEALGISGDWEAIVAALTGRGRLAYENLIRSYVGGQPPGQKHHFRLADRVSGACSPMTLDYTPVGKMFFEGAPRLIAAGLSVLPLRVNWDPREAVEGYPKLVAQRYIGKAKYKTEKRGGDQFRSMRLALLEGLARGCGSDYGFALELDGAVREQAEADGTGDVIDAVLCLVQAGWSVSVKSPVNGIPEGGDSREGWIVDPSLG